MIPHRAAPGFTLIELLVVVAIIGVLAALLLPAISLVKNSARTVSCMSSQRQVFLSLATYGEDSDILTR